MRAKWSGKQALGLCLAALLAGSGKRIEAQEAAPFRPRLSVGAELQSLASRAAAVFVGQITSVERRGDVVEVTFRVEQPVTGPVGDKFVLREWAGQWAPRQLRYTPGLRALVFAHGASGAGLSSPVDGQLGLVPVVVQGADAPQLLDIRRLAAAVLRTPGTALPTGAQGGIQLSDALHLIKLGAPRITPEPVRVPIPESGAPLPILRPVQAGQVSPAAPVALPAALPVLRRESPIVPVLEGGAYDAQ